MDSTDRKFDEIANAEISAEANNLLDRQLARVRTWTEQRIANGEPADLRHLIRQVMAEPNKRGPVLVAYAAALTRLIEQEARHG